MKKILVIVLSVSLAILSFSFSIKATGDRTVLYLDYGNVKIGDGSISGYDKDGKLVTEVNPCGYTITQRNSLQSVNRGISVTDGEQDVEIKNINIARSGENDNAFCVLKNAKTKLILTGENHLVPGTYCAGVEIAVNASLTVEGDGILYTQSEIEAGIGGGSGHSNGTLTINSGTIYATGGMDGYGSGIGGGSSGSGGTITINGGNIVAVGGEYGAGIGGGMLGNGGKITINGGTVTATGGKKAAGIGGGFTANGGTVVINGGSVKATGGEGADDLGNGFNCKTAFAGIHNDDGNSVSILTVPLKEFALVCQNGIDKSSITAGHPDDENLYFYADSNRNIATVYMKDGTVKFINYNRAEFSETNPFINGDERFSKYLITSDKDNVSVIDGFSIESENENCRLIFNGSCVDKLIIIARGDVNLDGKLDGMDAVEAACVAGGMNNDVLAVKLADANFDGVVDNEDILALENLGITTKEPLN